MTAKTHMRRLLVAGVLGGTCLVGMSPVASAATVEQPVHRMIRNLPVGQEVRRGYDREKFPHWSDADGDCFDTRAEVLRAESKRPTRHSDSCTVLTGRWFSWYDGARWTDAQDLDTDHFVPLAESWDSGARSWTRGTRTRYANDLRDRRSLVAVTDNVNQAKSDQDPATWLPRRNKCRYVRQWVAVKTRWALRVDRREKRTLTRFSRNHCTNATVRVTTARVVKAR